MGNSIFSQFDILTLLSRPEFQSALLLLAALGACMAAIFTAYAARATAKANTGQTLLSCLENYINIMKVRRNAEEKKNPDLAKEFYREMFDLHWSEFHLWHEGAIPDHVMRAWLSVRQRNYNADNINCQAQDGTQRMVSYRDIWGELVSNGYFELNDRFVEFMNKAHSSSEFQSMKKLKKKTKPRK